MEMRAGLLSLALSLWVVGSATAQESLPSHSVSVPGFENIVDPVATGQLLLLNQWTHDYQEWRAWYLQWRNRPEPGWFMLPRARRLPPAPPAGLAALCAETVEENGPVADACAAWREWQTRDVAAEAMTQEIAQTRARSESPVKTQWWERVHVDALWPMTQSGSSAFGVAGVHTTVHVTKRLQVFLAPGFILMRVPALDGSRTWTSAADWGFSYGLFDLRVPVAQRRATVHLNVARVWILGSPSLAQAGETYLAGLSLSFKQR